MTRHGPMLLALLVLAIASWTYNVNYDTRAALERVSKLRAQIADEHENLQVLRVEWAYLNAPDRLARLVGAHNDELALAMLTPDSLGQVASVPYPRRAPTIPTLPEEFLVADAGEDGSADMASEADGDMKVAALDAGVADVSGAGEHDDYSTLIDSLVASVTETSAPEKAAPAQASDDPLAEKAEALTARKSAPEPTTMEEAVQLTLAEAGIAASEPAPVITASVSGVPMPAARPAVLVRQ